MSNIHYVYWHIDPVTKEKVYVGAGSKGRAWNMGYTRNTTLRSAEHLIWFETHEQSGFTLWDIVVKEATGLSRSSAFELEAQLMRKHKPRFNTLPGASIVKLSPELLARSKVLREEGKSYELIAAETGLSTMTIYRGLNGQTKNIEVGV